MKTITIKDITISLSDDDLVELKKQLEEKTKFPKWEDIGCVSGYYIYSEDGDILRGSLVDTDNKVSNGIRPTRELCEASIALAKLTYLRDIANNGWVQDLNNGACKYGIINWLNTAAKARYFLTNKNLSFKDEGTRDGFLEAYKDLITIALPLL